MRMIKTDYVHPPIPTRTHDWCAWVDGTEEDGLYGWGRTEADALRDLDEQLPPDCASCGFPPDDGAQVWCRSCGEVLPYE